MKSWDWKEKDYQEQKEKVQKSAESEISNLYENWEKKAETTEIVL